MSTERKPVEALTKTDLKLIRTTHAANAHVPGAPYLPAPTEMKRCGRLASLGYLRESDVTLIPNPEGWRAYFVTAAGVDAYNAALAAVRGGADHG